MKENYPHYYINQSEDCMYVFHDETQMRRFKKYQNNTNTGIAVTSSRVINGHEKEIADTHITVDQVKAETFYWGVTNLLSSLFVSSKIGLL